MRCTSPFHEGVALPGKLLRMAGRTGLVALGTACGQVCILASTPYLTRRHAPAEFGQLALLLTLTNIVVATGCLRYDLALPVAKEGESLPLFLLCGGLALALAILACAAAFGPWGSWLRHPIGRLLASPWTMLLVVLGVGAYQAAGSYLVQAGWFAGLALLRTSQGLLFAAVASLTSAGLLWANLLSYLAGGLLVGALLLWRQRTGLAKVRAADLAQVAGTYAQFPAYSLPGALLDALGYSACIWIVTSGYGLTAGGHYSQLQRLIGAPMLLASMSLSQVMLKQSADELQEGRPLWPLVKSVGLSLAILAAFMLVLLLLWGSQGLGLLLGPGWRVDPYFVGLIALAVFIRSTVSPLSAVLVATQRFRPAFLWQSGYFLSTLTLLRWLSHHLGFDGFVLAFTCHEAAQYTLYFLIIRAIAKG